MALHIGVDCNLLGRAYGGLKWPGGGATGGAQVALAASNASRRIAASMTTLIDWEAYSAQIPIVCAMLLPYPSSFQA
jgi:hypothetical protein